MRRTDVLQQARARAAVAGVVLLGLAAAACGGGDVTNPLTPADVTGIYPLASIDGRTLPAPYGQGTTVIYDTLTLARDSTFVERDGGGALGSTVVTDSGTYTGRWTLGASGGQIVLRYAVVRADSITATLTVVNRSASLTLNVPRTADPGSGLWVYNRVR